MARNVEVKVRVADADAVTRRATALWGAPALVLAQHDVFFAVAHGRLKLRRGGDDGGAELIHYERPDTAGLRTSRYRRVPLAAADADALHAVLADACGEAGRVRKARRVWLVDDGALHARVHVDRVEALGDFVELEVVLRPAQPPGDAAAAAERWLQALGLAEAPRIAGAYRDLPGRAA